MYCNVCGKSIQDDANLCGYCGARVGYVHNAQKLVRPRVGRKIAGVCAGMADYFGMDESLMRVIWVLLLVFSGGLGLIVYLLAWVIIPEEPIVAVSPASTTVPTSHTA